MQQVRSDRYFTALLLGELGEEASVPALIAATRDESVNYRAATSLGEIGDVSALPDAARDGGAFPEQRGFAGYGLAALGEPDGFAILENVALTNVGNETIEDLTVVFPNTRSPILPWRLAVARVEVTTDK